MICDLERIECVNGAKVRADDETIIKFLFGSQYVYYFKVLCRTTEVEVILQSHSTIINYYYI